MLVHPAVHKAEIETCDAGFRSQARFGKLLGGSAAMQELYDQIERIAPRTAGVLIVAENGSGKDLVAHTLHTLGRRRSQLFLQVKCAGTSPQLLESQLFGHEKDGMTGAWCEHRGFLERAHGGTILLDEITEIPLELQAKLLRVLESGTLSRVGSDQEVQTDVRVLAATHRNPEEAVAKGKLHADLFCRLGESRLQVPPLRARDGDVILLATYFLHLINVSESTRKTLSPGSFERLNGYSWPGNVRELKNLVHRSWILADTVVDLHCAPFGMNGKAKAAGAWLQVQAGTRLADMERQLILATLAQCNGAREKTAELLGISLKTLYNRLHEYGCAANSAGPVSGTPDP